MIASLHQSWPGRDIQNEGQRGDVRVMIVDHAFAAAELMRAGLEAADMEVDIAISEADAVARMAAFRPDIVLMEAGVPGLDGLDGLSLVRRISADGDCGVIVVSADNAESARIEGLETGADDYIVRPVGLRELAARIRAVHRRLSRQSPPDTRVILDPAQRCLIGPGGVLTALTAAEFAMLETLVDADGASVSREWLARVALKRTLDEHDRSVDQLVLKLRRKLAGHGMTQRAILSSRGLGYVIPDPSRFRPPIAQPPGVQTRTG